MNNDIRWQYRFENFEKYYLKLDSIIDKGLSKLDKLEKMGVVLVFEVLIELSCNVLRDYLDNEGYASIESPRNVIRQAFADSIINDPETWMQALQKRELTNDTYKEEVLQQLITFTFEQFYPIVRDLYFQLKNRLDDEIRLIS